MNPQPNPMIGHIIAVIFVFTIIYYTIRAIQENNVTTISDNFVIGYIESDPPIILSSQQPPPPRDRFNNQDPQPKPRMSRKIKSTPNFESQQFYTDCIDALIALGMKKREAKKKATTIFSTMKPQPSTIQDFLITALKT